jgi:hypothetical protein
MLLVKHNVKIIHIPLKKTINTLQQVKDILNLKTPCECVKKYVGQTGRIIQTRHTENMGQLHLGQLEKSALVEYIMDTGHDIKFNNTYRTDNISGYLDRLVKQAIEIHLHSNNFNSGERCFMLS